MANQPKEQASRDEQLWVDEHGTLHLGPKRSGADAFGWDVFGWVPAGELTDAGAREMDAVRERQKAAAYDRLRANAKASKRKAPAALLARATNLRVRLPNGRMRTWGKIYQMIATADKATVGAVKKRIQRARRAARRAAADR